MPRADMPLSGLRVLDISTLYSAPLAAAILADFGAEVLKIEPPLTGDPMRKNHLWSTVARNKTSITLDLGKPRGIEIFRDLVPHYDLVIENLPPKLLRERQLEFEDLETLNPNIVVLSISMYGRTGPHAERPGSGSIAEAFGGLTHMIGDSNGPPRFASVPLGDAIAALSGVIGAVAACYGRDTQGLAGQHVDLAMYEPILQMISPVLATPETEDPPKRTGNYIPGHPYTRDIFSTLDGDWLAIVCSTERQERDLDSLTSALNHADKETRIAKWLAHRTTSQALAELGERRVPATPVNDLEDLLNDPHIRERGSLIDAAAIDHSDEERWMTAPTPRLSRTPGQVRSLGPSLGESNERIYKEVLGLSDLEIDRLAHKQVI